MTHVKQALSNRIFQRLPDVARVVDLLVDEIMPVLASVRRELNKTNGDMVTVDDDYEVQRTDRNIIATAACTVNLPLAETVKEQIFTVFNASGGLVTVTYDATSTAPAAGSAAELFSDGVSYHLK